MDRNVISFIRVSEAFDRCGIYETDAVDEDSLLSAHPDKKFLFFCVSSVGPNVVHQLFVYFKKKALWDELYEIRDRFYFSILLAMVFFTDGESGSSGYESSQASDQISPSSIRQKRRGFSIEWIPPANAFCVHSRSTHYGTIAVSFPNVIHRFVEIQNRWIFKQTDLVCTFYQMTKTDSNEPNQYPAIV